MALEPRHSPQLTARQLTQVLGVFVSTLGTIAHADDVLEALDHFCEARAMYRAELRLRNKRSEIHKRAP